MPSIKCPQCGLVNFASASQCKRCHHEFIAPAKDVDKAQEQPLTMMPDEQPLPIQNDGQPAQAVKTFTILPVFEPVATPIGGWLIVFVIGLGFSFSISAVAIQKYINYFSMNEFHALTTEGSRLYISGFSTGVIFEFIWNCIVAVSTSIMVIRLFRKSRSFPRLAIAILSLNIVVATIDYFMAVAVRNELADKLVVIYGKGQVPELLPSYFGLLILYAIVTSVVWIGYFIASRRVETTFVY